MEITKPTLLVDKDKCLRNIEKMIEKASSAGASLRPHFKTHHSSQIAEWYRNYGITQCTVSSVSMAHYFVLHGWDDITIAFPYNPLEAKSISRLAEQADINILIESKESLDHAKKNIKDPVGFFIKVDVGTHRTGVDHRNEQLIGELVKSSDDQTQFKGFLAHAGHTYGARDKTNIQWIFDGAEMILTDLKKQFGGMISFGDTPSCSMIDDLSSFDELRPGNFIFYDWMQHQIGSCQIDEIAVCMACPVVALHPERNEVVVYGGAVHFSKDSVPFKKGKTFGQAVELTFNGWKSNPVGTMDRLSQEHGIIQMPDDEIARIKIGDVIGVIPVHSCLAADLQGHYLATNGEQIDKIIKD